jgi:hypothetical protein
MYILSSDQLKVISISVCLTFLMENLYIFLIVFPNIVPSVLCVSWRMIMCFRSDLQGDFLLISNLFFVCFSTRMPNTLNEGYSDLSLGSGNYEPESVPSY